MPRSSLVCWPATQTRNLGEPMFDARTMVSGLLQGIGAMMLTLGALLLDMGRGRSEADVRGRSHCFQACACETRRCGG